MALFIVFALVLVSFISHSDADGSWDVFIDNLISQSKDISGQPHCDKAGIIGIADGASWTTTANAEAIKLQGTEGPDIAKCFGSSEFSSFMMNGVNVEGEKYMFLRAENGNFVVAKKRMAGTIIMQSSTTAIVIAHCPEGRQQGQCGEAVSTIAEYLDSNGM